MSTSFLGGASASLPLPAAPASLTGPVKAWAERLAIPTSAVAMPNKNPIFTDEKNRGLGYPSPMLEGSPHEGNSVWQAIHLENEFLRLLILPELGGRIHLALDKATGSEFLYREDAIHASGSRLRGGLEVHWPSSVGSSRVGPPVTTYIEEPADGSRTIWCSAYDPISRLKGMHGVCLYPGRAYIELKVRLFNRTSFSQFFTWSTLTGVPDRDQTLAPFPELATPGGPVGFFGAYCSATQTGLLQVAEQHTSGGQSFTLRKGYGELRAGRYSGMPPKVSTLAPFETKSFSQFWYPFTGIGTVQIANVDAALKFTAADGRVAVGVVVTRAFPGASLVVETEGTTLHRWSRDFVPGQPLLEHTTLPPGIEAANLVVRLLTSTGRELISFTPAATPQLDAETTPQGSAGVELLAPRKLTSLEAVYGMGLRAQFDPKLEHMPEEYWQEALRRDPVHSASHNALGLVQLHRGEFGEAESHFRAAIATQETTGSGEANGEFHYNLGLSLRYQEQDSEASAAFLRATWHFAWRAPALQAIAELECKRGNFGVVPKFLYEALRLNADNNNARSLAAVLFRRFGRVAEAEQLIAESLTIDPLDPWSCQLAGRPFPGDNQTRLDLAFDYARAGLYQPAIELLTGADTFVNDGSLPMVHYTLASLYMRIGDLHSAQREFQEAAAMQPDFCFPHRLDEMMVLARAIALQPEDARAQYYLDCLLYYYGLPLQALEIWDSSTKLDGTFSTVWRNLAIGHHNVTGDHGKALDLFDQAVSANPRDAFVFYERDQLWKRLGVPPTLRFQEMQQHKAVAETRPDAALELATLYNTNGEPDRALALFSSGVLAGWEQDLQAVEQYIRAFVKLGRMALAEGENDRARDLFLLPLATRSISSEGGMGTPKSVELWFWLGEALNAAGHLAGAQNYWQQAATLQQRSEGGVEFNEATFFVALCLGRIGERQHSRRLLRELWFGARRMGREKPQPGEPRPSALTDDAVRQQRVRGLLLQSQARVGLGQYKLAGRLLEQLLTLDPNNGRALDLISDLEQSARD